ERGMRGFRAKLIGTERKLEQVRAQVAELPTHIPFSEDYVNNPILQTFKSKLAEVEIERYRLLQGYLPTDRHVQDKDQEIASIQNRMRSEKERVLSGESLRTNDLRND